jgi:FkbM family methyltransferase
MRQLKKMLSSRFPELAGAYHTFRLSHEMRRHPEKTTPFGFRFMGNARMQNGSFEPDETRLLQRVAARTDVFVDVGANIGYYVCLMRSLGKHVVAIEPLRQNLDFLFANLAANRWTDVEVLPVGLAAKPGVMEIYGGGTAASLIPNWAGASGVLRNTVPISTLDNMLGTRFDGRRLAIKIDVEGVELDVLHGAQRTLAMSPAPRWLIEICLTENHPDGCNPDFGKVFDLLWANGYAAYSVEAGLRLVTPADVERWFATRKRDFGYVSFFFEKSR